MAQRKVNDVSKCCIIDENNKMLPLTHDEAINQITYILKNGKAANGIIRFENKAYEYVELNFDGEIIRILKSIRPRKYKAELRFGFEDPSLTGELLGIIALLYPKLKDDVRVIPDFENKVFEGSI